MLFSWRLKELVSRSWKIGNEDNLEYIFLSLFFDRTGLATVLYKLSSPSHSLTYCLLTSFIGADVEKKGANKTEFRYPSYVQHIMGYVGLILQ